MAQKLMWNQIESQYRGQGTNGAVVTVEVEAMDLATRKAGKSVYDTDWWIETLQNVLEHWGIYTQRWTDAATKVPRIHFSVTMPRPGEVPGTTQQPYTTSGPLNPMTSGPLNTGTLRERLLSNKQEGDT